MSEDTTVQTVVSSAVAAAKEAVANGPLDAGTKSAVDSLSTAVVALAEELAGRIGGPVAEMAVDYVAPTVVPAGMKAIADGLATVYNRIHGEIPKELSDFQNWINERLSSDAPVKDDTQKA